MVLIGSGTVCRRRAYEAPDNLVAPEMCPVVGNSQVTD